MTIKGWAKKGAETYAITPTLAATIALGPLLGFVTLCILFAVPATRSTALWMIKENRPVELLTFGFLLLGGAKGLTLVRQTMKRKERAYIVGFYFLLSLGLLWTAMEEISWGQTFFRFATPSTWKAINMQSETNIHNLEVLGGRSELFRLAFGLGGMVGVWFSGSRMFRKIGVPIILLPTVIAITIHASVDLYVNIFRIEPQLAFLIDRSSEGTELLIGIIGVTYVWLNARMFDADGR